jgi:hypothetical protein
MPDASVLLCEQTPESLARGLMDLLADPARAEAMGAAGARFMADRPIEHGLEQFRATVAELLAGRRPAPSPAVPMYTRPALVGGAPVAAAGPGGETALPDMGRLAVLPPLPRKVIRFFYHRLRRLWS